MWHLTHLLYMVIVAVFLLKETRRLLGIVQVCSEVQCLTVSAGDLHMCAPGSFRLTRCLLRGSPDGGHANDQTTFPDRNK